MQINELVKYCKNGQKHGVGFFKYFRIYDENIKHRKMRAQRIANKMKNKTQTTKTIKKSVQLLTNPLQLNAIQFNRCEPKHKTKKNKNRKITIKND